MTTTHTLCVVGLGYVGLPLAHAFAKKGYKISGFDVNERRIAELNEGHDHTNELTDEQLAEIDMVFSTDPAILSEASIIIVAVPTPIDDNKKPDLRIVEAASTTVGQHMKPGTIVVFESTVYPGTTEEICGPILEKESGLKSGVDFKLGYSPERINPGDKEHTIDKILKIVAGQDEETLRTLSDVYGSIITAGIHEAPNIKVAELAKAIENAQRDLNIAFVNEIAMMCNKVGIHSKDVFEAAGTKWNFLRFQPGLVGGHCIGVDPYYLVEKAQMLGMDTEVITAGRSVNDGMGAHVAQQIADGIGDDLKDARVLLLGVTFKENVPDMRNSKVKDVAQSLAAMGCEVVAHDPMLANDEMESFGYKPSNLQDGPFDAVVLLVPHREYMEAPLSTLTDAVKEGGLLYDLKSLLNEKEVEEAGRKYRAL